MTIIINKDQWKEYFDELSRKMVDFETSIQILSGESGAQMISSGLPFNGITLDENDERSSIEISVGNRARTHLSHNIFAPKMVAFEATDNVSGTLDIEESDGTKTLVRFTNPRDSRVSGFGHERAAKTT
ncbi:MAG: DUF5335 family protein [Pyrinomonadaceae bacterium]|nr:DUF5335 family protein [Pyrinomonadaceae bacterium]